LRMPILRLSTSTSTIVRQCGYPRFPMLLFSDFT
jgi:hypothetical protein